MDNPFEEYFTEGKTFNYLGVTFIVLRFDEYYDFETAADTFALDAEYIDAHGNVVEKIFGPGHLMGLLHQNQLYETDIKNREAGDMCKPAEHVPDNIAETLNEMRVEAEAFRDDTEVSTREGICNERIAKWLEHFAKDLEKCLK